MLGILAVVMPERVLFAPAAAEGGNAFEITDDAGAVVDVVRAAAAARLQGAFVDVAAVVADGIWNVECEVVATFLCSDTQQLTILWLREVLFEVHVKCRTTS